MATVFTMYDGSDPTLLTAAIVAPSSGIVIESGTVTLAASGPEAVNFYDGSLTALGIGSGLLLTSGHAPATTNTVGWDGQDNSAITGFNNGDATIDAVVNTVFQTQSYDATTLSFNFTVTDPTATSVSFDLVFGSDEYPEWVDQFVDCAVVMVNGVNYALFNHDPLHPLSVISSNLAAGYFQDNVNPVTPLPIEYDGVSHVLKIVAPIIPGGAVNSIKIGIADTGDHIYDSGIFIANMSAGAIPGSGVVSPATAGDDTNNVITGTAQDEYFDLKGGDDVAYAGAGDDIIVGGSGNDTGFGGSGADQMKGDSGNDTFDGGDGNDTAVFAGAWAGGAGNYSFAVAGTGYTITDSVGTEGTDTLNNVEFAKFSDGVFAVGPGGLTPVIEPPPVPTNTPGLAFISGIGAPGQTLTANVTDADGVPADVTYSWFADGVDLGVAGNTLLVDAALVGQNISFTADYTDLAAHPESVSSATKAIIPPGDGDFSIVLLNLVAPAGAIVQNPLTTLIQDAIATGVSPGEALNIVKGALGLTAADLGADVDLLHYDSWVALQADPSDALALAVEKRAVQVAVMTSLGGDDTGMTLTQAVLLAHSNSTPLDLSDETTIANVLGIVPPDPALVHEIWDRNNNIQAATTVDQINSEWLDMQSGLDVVLSSSIGDLSVHLNSPPTGSPTANLAAGTAGAPYTVTAADLLQGFSDADGDSLNVVGLAADNGAVTDNGDGTFTIAPPSGYAGPIELSYSVADGNGGTAAANQLFVVAAAPNNPPTGSPSAVLTAGLEDVPYTVSAADLLQGFDDPDGDPLSVADLGATAGAVTDNLDGTFTIAPPLNYNGPVGLTYTVNDGKGGTVAAAHGFTLDPVNDDPTGSVDIAGVPTQGQQLTASNTLVDPEGLGPISYQWKSDGADISGATGANLTLTQSEVGKLVTVTASYTDQMGTPQSVTSAATDAIANIDDPATGTLSVTGTAAEGGQLQASLTGVLDPDGATTTAYQWQHETAGGWADIDGQTTDTLAIPSDQSYVGQSVRVVATTTDPLGGNTAFFGDARSVANVNDPPTGDVTISGTPMPGQTLTASNTLADADGLGVIGYQWQADGTDITGATGTSYSVTQAQSGQTLTVTASYTDAFGAHESITSAATARVPFVGTAGADTLNGGPGDDTLFGLDGRDRLNGDGGNDTLDGGPGRDTMAGGVGDDIYHVDSTGDVINELAGEGNDTVVSHIPDYTLEKNVENLTLAGTGANGTGNDLANIMIGNDLGNVLNGLGGNDDLRGGAGNDTLIGGAGNDLLTGGGGLDAFRFDRAALSASTNLDTIFDFQAGDRIEIDNQAFKALKKTGPLSADNFAANAGGQAMDGNDHITYDTTTGALCYDPDGSGSIAATQFATLMGHPALTAADLVVI